MGESIVTELSRMSLDLEVPSGQPTEPVLRMALEHLLISLAQAVKNSDDEKYWFPIFFPMEMTLESEQLRWNFRLVLKIKNQIGCMEDKETRNG